MDRVKFRTSNGTVVTAWVEDITLQHKDNFFYVAVGLYADDNVDSLLSVDEETYLLLDKALSNAYETVTIRKKKV